MSQNNNLETAKYEDLVFSSNFNNKLNANCYTTIRLYNPKKFFIGKRFNVMIDKRRHHTAEVVAVSEITLEKVSEAMAFIDTGLNKVAFTKLFTKIYEGMINVLPTTPLSFAVLRKLDV